MLPSCIKHTIYIYTLEPEKKNCSYLNCKQVTLQKSKKRNGKHVVAQKTCLLVAQVYLSLLLLLLLLLTVFLLDGKYLYQLQPKKHIEHPTSTNSNIRQYKDIGLLIKILPRALWWSILRLPMSADAFPEAYPGGQILIVTFLTRITSFIWKEKYVFNNFC